MELYHHPGEKVTAASALRELITLIFRHARNQYANQPLTMTPYVQVKPFAPDFNYWGALVHGHRAGWDYLTYGGGSSAELCYQIWSLSDIIAFPLLKSTGNRLAGQYLLSFRTADFLYGVERSRGGRHRSYLGTLCYQPTALVFRSRDFL